MVPGAMPMPRRGAKVTVQKAGWDFAPESITVTNEDEMIWFEGSARIQPLCGQRQGGWWDGIPVVVISVALQRR